MVTQGAFTMVVARGAATGHVCGFAIACTPGASLHGATQHHAQGRQPLEGPMGTMMPLEGPHSGKQTYTVPGFGVAASALAEANTGAH